MREFNLVSVMVSVSLCPLTAGLAVGFRSTRARSAGVAPL